MNSVALRVPAQTSSQSSGMFLEVQDGFAVRQGHLAPPNVTPDSPRPQKNAAATEPLAATTLTVPTDKAELGTKTGPTTRAASKSPNRASKKK